MTRTQLVALSLPVLALFAVAARKPDHPKHENHYQAKNAPATDVAELALNKAESQQEFLKVDAKITNKTSDRVLILQKTEAELVLPSGTVKVKPPALFGGPLVIPPNDSRSYVWMADGKSGFHVDSFSLKPKGLSVGSNTGTTLAVPDFQLPPSQNTFTVGGFSCNLTKHDQNTDDTNADFACTYNGTGVGFIDARKIGARSQSGTEYANMVKNAKRDVVLPGDKAKFGVWIKIPASDGDMQFKAFHLLFRDAFAESALTPVTLEDWAFELDAAKTAKANE